MSPLSTNRYKNHRFPAEIISHGVWLYFRFCLSSRDVEELLFARGVMVTYEAIRQWCRKFGQEYANQPWRRRPRAGDTWHLDEVFLTINGARHYPLSLPASPDDHLPAAECPADRLGRPRAAVHGDQVGLAGILWPDGTGAEGVSAGRRHA